MGIITLLSLFIIVIGIHEGGHYLACRYFGIPVNKFAVGIGKPIWTKVDSHGTEWSLRPIPLGGFIEPEPVAMATSTPFRRLVISLAGPMVNILPILLLAAVVGKFTSAMQLFTTMYSDTFLGFLDLATFGIFTEKSGDIVGPVGMMSQVSQGDPSMTVFVAIFVWFVTLSVGVGLFNLLPFIPLDGGNALGSIIEIIAGKACSAFYTRVMTGIGVVLLFCAIVHVMIRDIGNLL